jgi:hypothetical protein
MILCVHLLNCLFFTTRTGDMYLFDEFQTSQPAFSRRPVITNLYDVFCNIRDDEKEHVSATQYLHVICKHILY